MATLEQSAGAPETGDGVRRRDFINIAAVSFVGVGAAAAVVPLVTQMNPSAACWRGIERGRHLQIAPWQAIRTVWRNQPCSSSI